MKISGINFANKVKCGIPPLKKSESCFFLAFFYSTPLLLNAMVSFRNSEDVNDMRSSRPLDRFALSRAKEEKPHCIPGDFLSHKKFNLVSNGKIPHRRP